MIDCHLHLQDERLYSQADRIMERLRKIGVKALVVNGTEPGDWDRVADLAERFPEVIPFFGLHPWKVNGIGSGWAETLREYLDHFPNSGVGEVGLDKWIRDHDVARQKEVLGKQLRMAGEMGKPVAIHCLQAWGHLLECLQSFSASGSENQKGRAGDSPTVGRTLLHSFGGPTEMVESFVELGVYFSISGYFFQVEKSDKLEVFTRIPDCRLLIETDAPDMMPPVDLRVESLASDTNHPANIELIYKAVAAWKGKSVSDLAEQTESNFRAWCYADKARETASDRSEIE